MGTVTARIPEETAARLEQMAQATKRSKSFLVAEALHQFLENQSWQVARTKESLAQADAGQFAQPEEVKDAFDKMGLNLD